jgi:hypothetical protein
MFDDRCLSLRRFIPNLIRPSRGRRVLLIAMMVSAIALSASPAWCANRPPEVEAAIQRGARYLASSLGILDTEAGLVVYACLAAGESPDSPFIKKQVDVILKKCTGSTYRPTQHHNYEAGVDLMGLVAADREKYKDQIQVIADFLIKQQKPHGAWDYAEGDSKGDTSITQYGVLGLWAASRAGVQVPLRVWDEAAQWHFRTQLKEGAFAYHPLGGDPAPKHSMTVAGAGTMAVLKLMLSKIPETDPNAVSAAAEPKTKKSDKAFGVLERVNVQEPTDAPVVTNVSPVDVNYKPKTSKGGLDRSIGGGLDWLGKFYTIDKPSGWGMYYLYGLERVGSLTNSEKIGGRDWYKEGCDYLIKSQQPDGSFSDVGGPNASTCFAILFMTRATEKLVPVTSQVARVRAATYGGGLLEGGRGLPKDLGKVDKQGGQISEKKLPDTELDKVLAELGDPKSDRVEAAQKSLVDAIQVGQRQELIGQKPLLLKLAIDPRVEVRRTAFWALGRCNDLLVAPVLIKGLEDVDYDAAVEARNALCVLSRRPRGFGLPDDVVAKLPANATVAEKESAFEKWRDDDLRKWREWYQSVRPYSERDKLPD